MKRLLGLSLAIISVVSFASADGAASFDRIKQLAGTWRGTARVGRNLSKTEVTFRVTSGGYAVEEVIAPGTPHEMVTVYYLDAHALVLTHYCAMGNQPHMRQIASSNSDTISFDFAGGANIPPGGGHMHATSIIFESDGGISTVWEAKMGQLEMYRIVMSLHRAK